ncbi:MAG: SAP domain-containing protein [Candidatus Heimdallarchaeota archaeon]
MDRERAILPVLDSNHKGLLSLFLKPRTLDTENWQHHWSATLGKSYLQVIQEFIAAGLLARPTIEECLIGGLRVADIKPILRAHGLKVSGKKEILVKRLVDQRPDEARQLAATITNIYVCTEAGAAIAQQWKEEVTKQSIETEMKMQPLIANGKFRQAFLVREQLRKTIPQPMQAYYGGGMITVGGEQPSSWDDYDEVGFRAIYDIDPQTIPTMTVEKVETAKFNVLMSWMCPWSKNRYRIHKEFKRIAETKSAIAQGQLTLEKWRKEGDVIAVEISGTTDACSNCKRLLNRAYDLNHVPIIPNPDCANPKCCRCCYIPITRTRAELRI